jgi:hypothetical protein
MPRTSCAQRGCNVRTSGREVEEPGPRPEPERLKSEYEERERPRGLEVGWMRLLGHRGQPLPTGVHHTLAVVVEEFNAHQWQQGCSGKQPQRATSASSDQRWSGCP